VSLDRGIFTGIQYIMFHLVRGKVYFHIFLSAGVEIILQIYIKSIQMLKVNSNIKFYEIIINIKL
jgi:hypothetical protein